MKIEDVICQLEQEKQRLARMEQSLSSRNPELVGQRQRVSEFSRVIHAALVRGRDSHGRD